MKLNVWWFDHTCKKQGVPKLVGLSDLLAFLNVPAKELKNRSLMSFFAYKNCINQAKKNKNTLTIVVVHRKETIESWLNSINGVDNIYLIFVSSVESFHRLEKNRQSIFINEPLSHAATRLKNHPEFIEQFLLSCHNGKPALELLLKNETQPPEIIPALIALYRIHLLIGINRDKNNPTYQQLIAQEKQITVVDLPFSPEQESLSDWFIPFKLWDTRNNCPIRSEEIWTDFFNRIEQESNISIRQQSEIFYQSLSSTTKQPEDRLTELEPLLELHRRIQNFQGNQR